MRPPHTAKRGLLIADVGEQGLLVRLRARIKPPPPSVIIGIGDDAAALMPARGALEILTTDSLVEGVHFRRDWTAAQAIGHKALAVNLSDLAAMGATPRAALLSLALPSNLPVEDFDALIDGFVTLAERTGAPLVGGNLTRSPGPLVVDVTVIGEAAARKILRRSGARPGDELYLTGDVGGAAAGLELLARGAHRESLDAAAKACIERHERPAPRLKVGAAVARARAASAAMDLSDGLADAATQIASASGVGIVLEAASIPISPGAVAQAAAQGRDSVQAALAGGEDYELLFTVRPRRRSAFLNAARRAGRGLAMTCIGRVTAEPGVWVRREGRQEAVPPPSFGHF